MALLSAMWSLGLYRAHPISQGSAMDKICPYCQGQLSLSRLNHWLPRGQADPEVMQGTADFHHDITDTLLPQAALTTRQRLTLLLTCSIRSRREWSA